jgi:hypothetical protein
MIVKDLGQVHADTHEQGRRVQRGRAPVLRSGAHVLPIFEVPIANGPITVRGWLRAARGHPEALRVRAVGRQHEVQSAFGGGLEWLEPAGSPLGEAVAALGAAAAAAKRFFGVGRCVTSLWEFIVLISGGRLLRPGRQASG